MADASIEATLELWASSLREVKARIRPLFTQGCVAASASLFLDGLLDRSGARPDVCMPRRRVILARGGSRPSSAAAGGRRIGTWTRGLLIRRNIADQSLAYFTTWCPAGTTIETPDRGGGKPPGHRRQLRVRQDRVRPRPQRGMLLARLAPPRVAGHAGVRHGDQRPPSRQCRATPKNDAALGAPLTRWSVQEVRRKPVRLAQRRVRPAYIIA